VVEHWAAGLADVQHAVAHRDWFDPVSVVPGVSLYDLPLIDPKAGAGGAPVRPGVT
jgi:hypothetical protein